MKRFGIYTTAFIFALGLLQATTGWAQHTTQSVLSEHTWYKLSVAEEGVYKLDYSFFQSLGIDVEGLNPNQIRIFGNPAGALPERNDASRPDDLTEMAIYVSGADDGIFNEGDVVLFYGQEPTRWSLTDAEPYAYVRDRNYFSDTTYYFLCVDSGVDGLRVGQQASLPVEGATTIITDFPDFQWHEAELLSPYSIGQNWFGESVSLNDGAFTLPFVFPHLVTDKSLLVKASVLGRCKGSVMHYDLRLNNNLLVNNGVISSHGDYNYGNVKDTSKQCFVEGDTAVFSMDIASGPDGALLYLDYVEIYAWRQLIREGDLFAFRLFPSQFGEGKSAVWVQNASSRFWLWEVSNPLLPVRQEGTLSSNNFVFVTDQAVERRFFMFDPDQTLEVASCQAIANQNLHGITGADMLIIASPLFLQQAQELADYHANLDGLNSVVVDVEEIYNEFSTGTHDPTALRDFIRMVYRRNFGALKYVTLFGRPSFDFRDLLGYHRNFVPCYQKKKGSEGEMNAGTDDYFGLMDDNEGESSGGRVDIGIGRLPVSSVEEAEAVLRKIKLYDDLAAAHGDWKGNLLLFSDDQEDDYVDHNETYCNMLDTLVPALNAGKVYCGAYPVVNTSIGATIPQAKEEVMRSLKEGASVMIYTGHGGVKGLTADNVFTVSDINALENHERMPFVFTATCEFSKYDNPGLVSAGEQMFVKADGGTIAMLTACRPTNGSNNQWIGKALVNQLAIRDFNGSPQRLGDIIRKAKSNGSNFVSSTSVSVNINFVFFGDPAQRLALPKEEVVAMTINGQPIGSQEIQLNAMSMVTLEGEIRSVGSSVDTEFNGELWVRFYDKKTPFEVKFVNKINNTIFYETFRHYRNVIYSGRVSVNEGRFALSFQVPKGINLDYGAPRFEFYAYDSIRSIDAFGKCNDLVLGGVDPSAVVDNEGPQINFYWNTPDFQNGDVTERQGVLYADLYDAQGLYHYDYSLGRNITMSSNWAGCNNLVLNDHFEPSLDDFCRGRVTLPVEGLESGTYEFTLKAWDTQDNSSEARLWLTVIDDNNYLSQVWNYPNPFSDETYFNFVHLGEDGDLRVDLQVFDVMGRLVGTLSQMVTATNNEITPVRWNSNDVSGKPLRSGVYLYRFTLTDERGYSRTVSQKMIVTR